MTGAFHTQPKGAKRRLSGTPSTPYWCTAPDHPSPAGPVSIEFVEEAPDDDTPRLGAWLELRAQDPKALQATLDAGLARVEHPGHPSTFMAPGGQVFTIAAQSSATGPPSNASLPGDRSPDRPW